MFTFTLKKQQAVSLFKNASDMASALGITKSAVSQWADDRPIPAAHALRIRYELRPEHFDSVA
jgi:DNA-binding transcriptional regulator YdaS (Cro superfamily)